MTMDEVYAELPSPINKLASQENMLNEYFYTINREMADIIEFANQLNKTVLVTVNANSESEDFIRQVLDKFKVKVARIFM